MKVMIEEVIKMMMMRSNIESWLSSADLREGLGEGSMIEA